MTSRQGLGNAPLHATPAPPSDWVLRWGQAWERPGATALDLACGRGRHVRLLAAAGLRVTAVDRDEEALASLRDLSSVELLQADIEGGPWPLQSRRFDLVLVTNYLWRPLLPLIKAAVAPGGWLIYETFTDGQQTIGRPSRPEFLLRSGELLEVCRDLRVVGYEEGFLESSTGAGPDGPGAAAAVNGRYIQRVAAVHDSDGMAGRIPRHRLPPVPQGGAAP